MTPRRTLVVAARVPVLPSGSSVILRRLLGHFSTDEVAVLARSVRGMRRRDEPAPWPAVVIPAPPGGIRGDRYWLVLSAIYGVPWGLFAIARFRPATLTAVYPDEGSLLLGYLLHRVSGIPLVVYFIDLYLEEKRGWQQRLARWLQPRVLRRAARVTVLSGGLREHFRERHGVDAVEIRHCADDITAVEPKPEEGHPFVIGYSGNINETRLTLLRGLAEAVGGDPRYEIRYFTPASAGQLAAHGLLPANAHARFVAGERALVDALRACDVLYLPMEFEPVANSYDTLATSFATKSLEYFAAGRPVLVQSRADFFLTRFYQQHDCGAVVTDPGRDALMTAIERLRDDPDYRERLVLRAHRTGRLFEGARIADTLRAVLRDAEAAV